MTDTNGQKIVTDFGAVGNGNTDDWEPIQRAIDRISDAGHGILYFPPGQYFVSQEVQLRANNMTVLLSSAEILGPADHPTPAGGLMTVIDRDRPDRLLTNITVEGGLFTPRHPLDNGLCIAVGHHVLFKGCRVDCAGGQRGFAIQTDRYVTKKITTPIRFVRLVGCESFGGGENGLDIESAGDDNLIADVLVESMNISGGKDATIRCSANGNGHHLYHVLLSNIIITDTAHCMWYADVCRGLVDGVIMDISGSDGNCAGIDIRGAVDCAISNIIITGSGPGTAIGLTDAYRVRVSNFDIFGTGIPFTCGIRNGSSDASIGPGSIAGCDTGVQNASPNGAEQRAVYMGLEFDSSCQKNFDVYSQQNKYFNIVQRTGGGVNLIRSDKR